MERLLETNQLSAKIRSAEERPYLTGLTCWDDAQAALSTFQQKVGPDEDEKQAVETLEQVFRNPETAPETWGNQSPAIKEDIAVIRGSSISIGTGTLYSYHEVNH